MALDFQIAVDWDNDKFFHRYAKVTDAPNLFGTLPILMTTMRRAANFGSITDVPWASGGESDYGREYIIWQTSTTLSPTLTIGYNGSTHDLGSNPAGTYTAILWLRSLSASYDSVNWRIRLMRDTGTGIATSVTTTVKFSSGWKRFTVTGSTASSGKLYIATEKDNNATDAAIRVAGAMIIASATLPAGYNSGTLSLYDNIAQFCKSARWMHGFNEPYKDIAAAGRASFSLKNTGKEFSPENALSPLYGKLRPQRQVRVWGVSPNDDQRMWTGWIESIKPQPGANGIRECVIEAVDARKYLDNVNVKVPIPVNKTAKQIARDLLGYVSLPPSDNPFTPTLPPPEDYEEVFPYALDNHPDGMDALRGLREVLGAIQGKLYFGRSATVAVTDLHRWGGPSSELWVTLNDAFSRADYRYGENLINDVIVVNYKRKLGSATDKILWEADENTDVDPWDTEEVRATFKNPDTDSDKTIAGLNCYLEHNAPVGVNVTASYGANNVDITIENTTGAAVSFSMLRVRGQKLVAFNERRRHKKNTESIAEFGTRAREYDYKLACSVKSARRYARDILARFAQPRGEMYSVEFIARDEASEDNVVGASIGRMVRIQESQSEHDEYYRIVGVEVSAAEAMKKVSTRWFFERCYRGLILDDPVFGLLDKNHQWVY